MKRLTLPDHIRGLIFDCDGTIADTMPLHWEAWREVSARHGFAFAKHRFFALAGIPSRDIVRTLNAEHGLSLDPLTIVHDKEQTYLAKLDQIGPIELVLDIARAHYGRLPMAVASGGSRRVIERVLGHLGIRSLFQAVVTNEDVARQKPAPDIFLEAARRLGVPPANCRAFEDAELGLAAIRAAGMEAVDVRDLLAASASP